MTLPTNSPDSAFWRDLAQRFLQGEELRAHGEQPATDPWQWWLDGHPRDVEECKALSALAAVALGHPSGQAAWVGWLETLRTRSSYFRDHAAFTVVDVDRKVKIEGRIGTIETFRQASASFCRILQSESQQFELINRQASTPPAPVSVAGARETANAPHNDHPPLDTREERIAAVDAYLVRANAGFDGPCELKKRHVWLAAGYTDRKAFQAWQRGNGSSSADRKIRDVLTWSPEKFIRTLRSKQQI